LCPIAISKAFHKIKSEVEQCEKDSPDAKLFFVATELSNSFSKDLDALKLRIEVLKNQFSVTPKGKLAREMRKTSHKIKVEQQLHIFKLPAKMVHEVNIKIFSQIISAGFFM
jgi:hypothetical protein